MDTELIDAIDKFLGADETEFVVIKRSDWTRFRDAVDASNTDKDALAFELLPGTIDRPTEEDDD